MAEKESTGVRELAQLPYIWEEFDRQTRPVELLSVNDCEEFVWINVHYDLRC